jgi:hypothetical protein
MTTTTATHDDITLLPEFVRGHRLATISTKDEDGDYTNETIPVEDLDCAEVVTSQSNRFQGFELHRPVLDIDFPVAVIPSTTPGHGHLYIDKLLTWREYEKLLNVLAEVGIIERGYADASIEREHTAVRLPWVKKQGVKL